MRQNFTMRHMCQTSFYSEACVSSQKSIQSFYLIITIKVRMIKHERKKIIFNQVMVIELLKKTEEKIIRLSKMMHKMIAENPLWTLGKWEDFDKVQSMMKIV